MSDEDWVMPIEACETTPRRETGKGALGKWRAARGNTNWMHCQILGAKFQYGRAEGITGCSRDVCRRVLKARDTSEGPPGKAAAANWTRESRLSGMRGGLAGTWAMEKTKRARKAETPKQPSLVLRLRAPYFYPTSSRRASPKATDVSPWNGVYCKSATHL